jgi:hypothetical protein
LGISSADAALKRAYAIDERHVVTNRVMSTSYAATGRPGDAEKHLEFVADTTGTPAAKLALADHYIRTSRPHDARPSSSR